MKLYNKFPMLFALALVPAKQDIKKFLDRFENMALQGDLEDKKYNKTLAKFDLGQEEKDSPLKNWENISKDGFLNADQKAEWALRLGYNKTPIDLNKIATLKSPALKDAALFEYLQYEMQDLFVSRVMWQKFKNKISKVLKNNYAELIRQKHASWWQWIANSFPVLDHSVEDPELLSLSYYLAAQKEKGLKKIHRILFARWALSNLKDPARLSVFDTRAFEILQDDYRQVKTLADAVIAVDDKALQSQKKEFLFRVAYFLRESGRQQDSLVALNALNDFRIKNGLGVPADELLLVALFTLDQKNYQKAIYLFESLLAKKLDRFERSLALWGRAHAGHLMIDQLAGSSQKPHAKKVAEYYRQALTVGYRSLFRDDLLLGYADVLVKLGRPKRALKYYYSQAKLGSDRKKRIRALFEMVKNIDLVIRHSAGAEKRKRVEQQVRVMSYVAHAKPRLYRKELRPFYRNLEKWLARPTFDRRRELHAATAEIRKLIGVKW